VLPKSIQKAIDELSRLPGIGSKTAQRLAMFLLRDNKKLHRDLGEALIGLTEGVHYCSACFNLSDGELCGICADPLRDHSLICVVSEALDVVSIENTHQFKGTYHVLHGALSPMDGIGPNDLKINELIDRIKQKLSDDSASLELVLATNPSVEGEATALYIQRQFMNFNFPESKLKITRIARGIPIGGELEYADYVTLTKAMEGRQIY
jgi:recombination protein RecR